jgi:hypothetical protein
MFGVEANDMDLQALLPQLMTRAIAWAEAVAADVATQGEALDASRLADATTVGVRLPEKVRVLMVDHLPLPEDPALRAAAIESGLLGPNMIGLTLGHSILICRGHMSRSVLSHECRHVAQYEQDPSGTDTRQTGLASLGVRYKAPIFAGMRSRR